MSILIGKIRSSSGEVRELYGSPRKTVTFGGGSDTVGAPYSTDDGRDVTAESFGIFKVVGSPEQWKPVADDADAGE